MIRPTSLGFIWAGQKIQQKSTKMVKSIINIDMATPCPNYLSSEEESTFFLYSNIHTKNYLSRNVRLFILFSVSYLTYRPHDVWAPENKTVQSPTNLFNLVLAFLKANVKQ